MSNTIDLTADEPAGAPTFGGTTRVITDNELTGLLAEDARNAPASLAHPAVIRRSTLNDATPAPALDSEAPPDPMPRDVAVSAPVAADAAAVAADAAPVAADAAPVDEAGSANEPAHDAIIPDAPARMARWWLVLPLVALGAALAAWLAGVRL